MGPDKPVDSSQWSVVYVFHLFLFSSSAVVLAWRSVVSQVLHTSIVAKQPSS